MMTLFHNLHFSAYKGSFLEGKYAKKYILKLVDLNHQLKESCLFLLMNLLVIKMENQGMRTVGVL